MKEIIKVEQLTLGPIEVNCYIVYREGSKECLIIDPGAEPDTIISFLQENGLEPKAILLTHGHFDHIDGINGLIKVYPTKVYVYSVEIPLLSDSYLNVSEPIMRRKNEVVRADELVNDGEVLLLAGIEIKVIHTPGHTKGGCSYYIEEGKGLFCGDTVFDGSAGRTDFPTSSMDELSHSIHEKIMKLPESTILYTGHGPITTISEQVMCNPFFQ